MSSTRWTDSYLDTLRALGDPLADQHLQKLVADNEITNIRKVFAEIDSNNEIPPASTFPELSEFFSSTGNLPPDIDTRRINRGEMVFQKNAFTGALVLLAKSLPEGYAAPNLSIILNLSGNLRTHPYKRLLSTLQTVVNVSTFHGFQHGGRAVITAQKLRLLHAGIRHLTRRYRPAFESQYGVPVNQEDMLGTVMGFSYLVIEGMRTLNAGLTRNEEEDFFYLWRIFALMMGIHPPDKPDSFEHIPENVDDAAAFYNAYRRRHYVAADKNPDGWRSAPRISRCSPILSRGFCGCSALADCRRRICSDSWAPNNAPASGCTRNLLTQSFNGYSFICSDCGNHSNLSAQTGTKGSEL